MPAAAHVDETGAAELPLYASETAVELLGASTMSTVALAHTDAAVTPAPARHATPRRSSGSLLAASTSVRVTPVPTITKESDRDTAGAGVAAVGMTCDDAVAVTRVAVAVAVFEYEAGLLVTDGDIVVVGALDTEGLRLTGEFVREGDKDGESNDALVPLGLGDCEPGTNVRETLRETDGVTGMATVAATLRDGVTLAPKVGEGDRLGDRDRDNDGVTRVHCT